jgi:uracil-DNA glycosylase
MARTREQTGDGWTAAPFVPPSHEIHDLAAAAQTCTGCPLYRDTTQAVFGEGPAPAALMLVGEQPGDQEDRKGHPFVGPAGLVLRRCLDRAAIPVDEVYLTNAVKHFKHEPRGKRRIHQKPNAAEADACLPWLHAEFGAVRPAAIVALGAVAARSLLGRSTPIAASRGRPHDTGAGPVFVTYHPSSVLRAEDEREEREQAIVDDLTLAWDAARVAR